MIGADELFDWTKAEPEEIDNLRALERAAVEFLNEPGGRYWGLTAEIVEQLPWRGESPLLLGNEPADGVVELEEYDGTAWATVDTSRYMLNGRMLYLDWGQPMYRSPRWPVQIRATYSAGYEPLETDPDVWEGVPEDVKQAVRMLVMHWYRNPQAVVVGTTSAEVELGVRAIMRKYA